MYNFSYDAENRQRRAVQLGTPAVTTDYIYDGDGRRVTRTTGSAVTTFVYDAAGNLAGEYGASAPSPLPCQVSSPFVRATCFLTTDQLGSVRMVTDAVGTVISRHDYLPFGEGIPPSIGNRSAVAGYGVDEKVSQGFTGKERDAETGLDFFGARYVSGAQGRFTSPDPDNFDARLGLPQSWNMYAYTINNPLKYTDNDGRFFNVGTAIVGAAVGATVNVASYAISQYATEQSFDRTTALELAGAGAATGALAGFTFGASLAANAIGSVAVGTTANVINGAATRAITGEEVFDEDKVTGDLATGFIGSAAGASVYMVGTAAAMGVKPAAPSPLATVRTQLRHLAKLKAWEAAREKLDTNFARLGAVTGGLLAGAIDQVNQATNRAQQSFTSISRSWQSYLTFGRPPCTETWDSSTNTLHGCN